MDLEQIATTAVTSAISKTDRLKSFINAGEKEPAFDGHVYIYANDVYAKKDIKRVSVQVKGKGTVSKRIQRTIKYTISIVDLEIYMNNGGTMFFVVYVDKNTRKVKQIYYASLLPVKIKDLLKLNGEKSEGISVKFKKFPDDVIGMTDLFLNFYADSQKQISFAGKEIPTLEELEKSGSLESISFEYISSSGKTISENEIPSLLENKEMYVYANVKGGFTSIPVDYYSSINRITMSTEESLPVTAKKKRYYDSIFKTIIAERIIYRIGTCVTFAIPNDLSGEIANKEIGVNFTFDIRGTLSQRIQGLEFINAMLTAKKFEIGGKEFSANFTDDEVDKLNPEEYIDILKSYKIAKKVLDKLGVFKDLDLDKCTDEDIKKLNALIRYVEDGIPLSGLNKDIPLVAKYIIGNVELAMIFRRNSDGTYKIWNFFDSNFPVAQEIDGERIPISKFSILTADNLVTLDNVNFEKIIEDFYSINVSETLINSANRLMLELVKAFDRKGNVIYLETAKRLLDLQKMNMVHSSPFICDLNEMQILKRERPLNFQEKQKLYKILEMKDDNFVRAGVYLLLDELEEAKGIFDAMSEEEVAEFKGFPIYKFYNVD